jgi:hypothetical protein
MLRGVGDVVMMTGRNPPGKDGETEATWERWVRAWPII